MSEPNPPRRPLATFLRTAPGADAAPVDATGHAAPQLLQEGEAAEDDQDTAPSLAPIEVPTAHADADADRAESDTVDAAVASEAPSFLDLRPRARPSPRWHWALVAGLALLLLLQSVLADRARLAADAGHRPWISALCGVLRCSLPAWREPTAFTMTSREIRPLPGQAGVLQVQASIRNDARWAQAWPDLRLSLSDADGRLIGSGVFTPAQYLGEAPAATLEPGQSARVAFRVQEPAASTVAFTFEFL
ncbi:MULTISPECIES: DUF3426 domain-containing protein [unclassified Stenotrophomonas maltophilia group]|uniref:DUF3426 domain-containing protein n=1 Tax=unclassified Stenotrophomonas maltophilia group TaxID=2961925 RepID=UPI000D5427B0|nr:MULTISPECIES: DUF3426 domain-containing protein [unclassified Stenotrophomonas maltophilia group]AWH30704.1 DUF3426 domain-containing protein [Stenotrophomonas sp. YAU14A_MKIMI4_1]AWH34647.1 DUF3426 domain-containing protein [Stenotrophomonas sp. SAU14A_NAIMI4_8]